MNIRNRQNVLLQLEEFKANVTDYDSLNVAFRKIQKVLLEIISDDFEITREIKRATVDLYNHLIVILEPEKTIRGYEYKFYLDGYMLHFKKQVSIWTFVKDFFAH